MRNLSFLTTVAMAIGLHSIRSSTKAIAVVDEVLPEFPPFPLPPQNIGMRRLPAWMHSPPINKLPKALSYRARKVQIRKENKFRTIHGMWWQTKKGSLADFNITGYCLEEICRWHNTTPTEFFDWLDQTEASRLPDHLKEAKELP